MDKETFEKLYMCRWEPSERSIILCERLKQYYKETSGNVPNRIASIKWREFSKWRQDMGYTTKEVNAAKNQIGHLSE